MRDARRSMTRDDMDDAGVRRPREKPGAACVHPRGHASPSTRVLMGACAYS